MGLIVNFVSEQVSIIYFIPVLLLCVVLALIGAVRYPQLVEGSLVAGNLSVQGLLDEGPPLYPRLALLDGSHDPVAVLQLVTPLPEHLGVVLHLLHGLALHLPADALDVVTAVLLIQPDELVKVSLGPAAVAFLQ